MKVWFEELIIGALVIGVTWAGRVAAESPPETTSAKTRFELLAMSHVRKAIQLHEDQDIEIRSMLTQVESAITSWIDNADDLEPENRNDELPQVASALEVKAEMAIVESLLTSQLKRLNQIHLQAQLCSEVDAIRTAAMRRVLQATGISDRKLIDIVQNMKSGNSTSPATGSAETPEWQRGVPDGLTPSQLAAWDDIVGERFEFREYARGDVRIPGRRIWYDKSVFAKNSRGQHAAR
jgi:hypothetical protein